MFWLVFWDLSAKMLKQKPNKSNLFSFLSKYSSIKLEFEFYSLAMKKGWSPPSLEAQKHYSFWIIVKNVLIKKLICFETKASSWPSKPNLLSFSIIWSSIWNFRVNKFISGKILSSSFAPAFSFWMISLRIRAKFTWADYTVQIWHKTIDQVRIAFFTVCSLWVVRVSDGLVYKGNYKMKYYVTRIIDLTIKHGLPTSWFEKPLSAPGSLLKKINWKIWNHKIIWCTQRKLFSVIQETKIVAAQFICIFCTACSNDWDMTWKTIL